MTFLWALRRRRRAGERGAAMVEMALVLPVLILLVMGVLEFGLAWRASLTVSNALRSATRTAANTGEDRLADYNALTALNSAMAGIDNATILRVIIYEAPANGTVPASCLTAAATAARGVNNLCNVYTTADLAGLATTTNFGGTAVTCVATAWDDKWCPPTEREANPGATGGADYLGIYVEVDYDFSTGLFGDGITIEDRTIMRLEPKAI
jgi:Flp pilus assembly protein TadG